VADHTEIRIRRLDGGADLVIEDGYDVAREFFTKDASSAAPNGYDALAGRTAAHRVVEDDIAVMYRTMRVRSRRDAWSIFLADDRPVPWLRAIDRSWDLLDLDDDAWANRAAPRLEAAFAAMIGPHRQLTGVSKVLHLKRPRLVPILDALVVQQLGGFGRSPIALTSHYRTELRSNGRAVRSIVGTLADKEQIVRTPVRVMDALVWTSHPASSLAKAVDGWERRFERATPS
jgi:hypothetical protein